MPQVMGYDGKPFVAMLKNPFRAFGQGEFPSGDGMLYARTCEALFNMVTHATSSFDDCLRRDGGHRRFFDALSPVALRLADELLAKVADLHAVRCVPSLAVASDAPF